jgi:PAS domain S-box-containing protein
MKVSALMRRNFNVLKPENSMQKAALVLLKNKMDGAPVVDDEENLMGIFGKRQLYQALASNSFSNTQVKDLMIKEPVTISINDDISALQSFKMACVPVVDGSKVVGMVTQGDLNKFYYNNYKEISQELETIINSTYNAIISIDLDGKIRFFNPAAEALFRVQREDVIGIPYTNIFPEGALVQVMQTGVPQLAQKFEHNDRQLVSNRTPIFADGKIIGAVSLIQDVSDFIAIFEELQHTIELKEEMNAIIESSFDGIFVTDGDCKVLNVNQAYSRITGVLPEEVIGETMDDLVKRGIYDKSVSVLVREQLKPITLTQEVKTGKTILVTGNPIFDKNNKLFRIVTNVRDITELNQLKREVEHAHELSQHYQTQLVKAQLQEGDNYVFRSQKSIDMLDLVLRVAKVDSTVLIQGESGCGKELIADILYHNSLRKDRPMVRINCAAIPPSLIESELFGYEPGAFTGANKAGKMGIFQLAHEGTLFLDEIGELPLSMQVKILRAIQEREIIRVGGVKAIPVDVRIIAATNRDLWQMVLDGEFRKDLYYRLNVVVIDVPPLRERMEEIPQLTHFFLKKFNNMYGLDKVIDEQVIEHLMAYNWPGNVRELQNSIERAYVTTPGRVIKEIRLFKEQYSEQGSFDDIIFPDDLKLKEAVEQIEKTMILRSLNKYKSTRKAAAHLGVSQPTIVRKAARYNIKCNLYAE